MQICCSRNGRQPIIPLFSPKRSRIDHTWRLFSRKWWSVSFEDYTNMCPWWVLKIWWLTPSTNIPASILAAAPPTSKQQSIRRFCTVDQRSCCSRVFGPWALPLLCITNPLEAKRARSPSSQCGPILFFVACAKQTMRNSTFMATQHLIPW